MEILNPIWRLKSPRCNCCEEQGELCFYTCPNCDYVVLICNEMGTIFPKTRDLTKFLYDTLDSLALCPNCKETKLSDFRESKSDEIQKLGFLAGEYA